MIVVPIQQENKINRPDLAGWIAVAGMALCPLMDIPFMKDSLSYGRDQLFVVVAGISLCLYGLTILAGRQPVKTRWTSVGVLTCLSLVYAIGNGLAHRPEGSNLTAPFLVLAAELVYYLLLCQWLADEGRRTFLFTRLLPAMLLVQLVIGSLQYAGICSSHHNAFRITGPFFNPAPYAIYVAGLAVACVPFSIWSPRSIALAAVLCALLVQLQSRSAWMGALGGLIYLLAVRRGITSRTLVLAGLCLPLLVACGYRLYRLKADSATGRLLTWSVSCSLVRDHLFAGVGAGNFPAAYGRYQYACFKDSSEREKFRAIAADVRYAFNDELQVTAEDGIIGLSLRLAMLVAIGIRTRRLLGSSGLSSRQKNMCLAASSGIVVLLIAGLFSYPMTQLPVSLLFLTFCAALPRLPTPGMFTRLIPGTHNGSLFRLIRFFPLFAGALLLYAGLEKAVALAKWKRLDNALPPPGKTYQNGFSPLYRRLADNGRFLLDYADACASDNNYREAIRILERAKDLTPDPQLRYSLGEDYEAIGNDDLALQQYRYVAIAQPGLLRPYYLITRLYYKRGDQRAFRQAAMEALQFPAKRPTAETEGMRREIAIWLRMDQLPNIHQP